MSPDASSSVPSDAGRTEEETLARALADRLEQLGLADQLAAAGLPSYARDETGRPHWTDPGTGQPLTHAQLTELDGLLRSQGEDPAHAVPLELVQLSRQAHVRRVLLESDWHTYASLAEARGADERETRLECVRAAAAHELLLVSNGQVRMVPAFQLDAHLRPRADLAPLLRPLLAAGMEPWRTWAWLTQPAALLAGEVPERAAADPELEAMAATAAVRLAEQVALSR